MASSYDSVDLGSFVFGSLADRVSKKSPALTIAQVHQLIARAIEDARVKLPDTLAVLRYRQRRNYAAYRSHRKRTRARLGRRPSRRRKRKIL